MLLLFELHTSQFVLRESIEIWPILCVVSLIVDTILHALSTAMARKKFLPEISWTLLVGESLTRHYTIRDKAVGLLMQRGLG